MKNSYRIPLLLATAICVYVVGYHLFKDDPTRVAAAVDSGSDASGGQNIEVVGGPELISDSEAASENENAPNNASTSQRPPAEPVPTFRLGESNLPSSTNTNSNSNPNNTSPTTAATRQYTVQSGDSMQRIAQRVYGDANKWRAIATANPLVDPLKLRLGMKLNLPTLDEAAALEEPAGPAPSQTVKYTVRPNDSLSKIAQQFYGDANKWRTIYNANKRLLRNNPNNLRVGQELTIPPLLTSD